MAGYWFWRPCSDVPFLKKLFAEGGYQGPKSRTALAKLLPELAVEIVKRSDTAQSAAPTFRSPESCPTDGVHLTRAAFRLSVPLSNAQVSSFVSTGQRWVV